MLCASSSLAFALWTLAVPKPVLAQSSAPTPVPPDTEIQRILAKSVGGENRGIGIVVGVIDARGRRVITYGNPAKDDTRSLNGDTIFEIGSITKVFTSLVLMDMVQKGEVSVADPVSRYLPASVTVPTRGGMTITLQDLSTHRSGLPPEAPGRRRISDTYSVQDLYDFLGHYQLTRDIDSQFEYSNLGVGLLGYALSLRAKTDYESLLKARVLGPLGMHDTSISLSADMKRRLAVGHDATLTPVPKMDFSISVPLNPAGGLSSSANDLLTFLAANIGYRQTLLAKAMAAQVSGRWPAPLPSMPDLQIAYGWVIQTKNGNFIIWHNGGTFGFRTFMGFSPKHRAGVVVLSNWFGTSLPDDIGRHLLDSSYPLP
ncbi:MAG: serine hydrolase domain-containing protein [Acidobacteriota bacterium]